MNPVEIEEAVSQLASEPFDRSEFPFQFLTAFGNKKVTIDRLRKGNTNQSDVAGGVLQRSNIHLATCAFGEVGERLSALRNSPKTASNKVKFVLATDGEELQAEDLTTGETLACGYGDFPNHFGFFLPLAGITTVAQIRESSFDIRATSRLNRLYVTLLQDNPEWASAVRRSDMNHFMARLIFCFFAEDTDIFPVTSRFTDAVERMSARDSSDTHEVISELFRAMNTKRDDHEKEGLARWARAFPYVNGQLFGGSVEVPHFSKIARAYLIQIGNLDWTKINPDIFGSMIQAVADDEERGALGMHYTSVPNILKVLNPLFLDDLRAKLGEAGHNSRKLLNLRNRMAKIRVFDPACGSGNFLVIAYKEMREIEAEINRRRGEPDHKTQIPLTNCRGIELRDFPAEIARLALIIAEYQCDVLYRGQKEALAEFLPLDSENWITCGNALRLDWLSICPPTGSGVKVRGDDLFETPLDQSEIDFDNAGGETYICGNPPFSGFNSQTDAQRDDLRAALHFTDELKYYDLVSGWFFKAAQLLDYYDEAAFVATNSVVQGVQVPILWKPIFARGCSISFAHQSFIWKNNASNNAGVYCVVVALTKRVKYRRRLFLGDVEVYANNISGYLTDSPTVFVERSQTSISGLPPVATGNVSYDGGNLILSQEERQQIVSEYPNAEPFIRPLTGSKEFIRGERRYCVWIPEKNMMTDVARAAFSTRFDAVAQSRVRGGKIARNYAHVPFRFYMNNESHGPQIIIPRVSSGRRNFVTAGYISRDYIISDSAQAIYDAPLWIFAVISTRMHMAWVSAVSGRLKDDLRYSAIMSYNTFPLPTLTRQNKSDLALCAMNILVARETHFPATIAELYEPSGMPEDLLRAHEENDEVLERIYIGRRFRNDTERLEKLFELYAKMTGNRAAA